MIKSYLKHAAIVFTLLGIQPAQASLSELFFGVATGAGGVVGAGSLVYFRFKEKIASLEQKIDDQHRLLQNNTQSVDELRSHNEKNFKQVKTGVAKTQQGLKANTQQLQKVQSDVHVGFNELDHRMQQRFDGVDGKLTWLVEAQQHRLSNSSNRSTVPVCSLPTHEPQKRLLSHLAKTVSRRILK